VPSAVLRDQLIAEINDLKDGDELALWAHRCLPVKNTLTANDARAVETACQATLDGFNRQATDELEPSEPGTPNNGSGAAAPSIAAAAEDQNSPAESMVTPLRKEMRRRNKAHLAFVAAQPCLVCQRSPCDAHHLKFAQPRSLGRKVSDEFTVPLCRDHHHQLHRHGNEMAWWANLQIAPIKAANALWAATLQAGTEPKTAAAMKQSGQGTNLAPGTDAETFGSNAAGSTRS
jgi:hypothetical protein